MNGGKRHDTRTLHRATGLAGSLEACERIPEDVIRDGITGWEKVQAEIDAHGTVIHTEVVASTDARLDAAARAHVELSRCLPSSSHGFDGDTMRIRDRVIPHAMNIARARGRAGMLQRGWRDTAPPHRTAQTMTRSPR